MSAHIPTHTHLQIHTHIQGRKKNKNRKKTYMHAQLYMYIVTYVDALKYWWAFWFQFYKTDRAVLMAGFLGGREKVGERWKRDKKQHIEVCRMYVEPIVTSLDCNVEYFPWAVVCQPWISPKPYRRRPDQSMAARQKQPPHPPQIIWQSMVI